MNPNKIILKIMSLKYLIYFANFEIYQVEMFKFDYIDRLNKYMKYNIKVLVISYN